jgi:hypothetical protein
MIYGLLWRIPYQIDRTEGTGSSTLNFLLGNHPSFFGTGLGSNAITTSSSGEMVQYNQVGMSFVFQNYDRIKFTNYLKPDIIC